MQLVNKNILVGRYKKGAVYQYIAPHFKTLIMATEKISCSECEGTGTVCYSCCGDNVKGTEHQDYGICPSCKEHIGTDNEPCENCGGTGEIERPKSICIECAAPLTDYALVCSECRRQD